MKENRFSAHPISPGKKEWCINIMRRLQFNVTTDVGQALHLVKNLIWNGRVLLLWFSDVIISFNLAVKEPAFNVGMCACCDIYGRARGSLVGQDRTSRISHRLYMREKRSWWGILMIHRVWILWEQKELQSYKKIIVPLRLWSQILDSSPVKYHMMGYDL